MLPDGFQPYAYAAMRMIFGAGFLCHGLQKFGFFGGQAVPLFSWHLGVAGPLEVLFGAAIVVGLLTKVFAFLASGQMAFAYFYVHQPQGGLPLENGGELAVLYCFSFLYMASRGSGILSLDAVRAGSRRRYY